MSQVLAAAEVIGGHEVGQVLPELIVGAFWAQASANEWQRNSSPAVIARLTSSTAEPGYFGSVKWIPLSVSTVCKQGGKFGGIEQGKVGHSVTLARPGRPLNGRVVAVR